MKIKKLKRKERGITLIALVVTIIVLLIIAGISIMMLTGQNGILKQAKKSTLNTEQSTLVEQLRIEIYEKSTDLKKRKTDDMEYLKSKGLVQNETKEGYFVVNIEKLVSNPETGKGDLESGDVYYLNGGDLYYKDKTSKVVKLGEICNGEIVNLGNTELPEGFKWIYEPETEWSDERDENVETGNAILLGMDLSNCDCTYEPYVQINGYYEYDENCKNKVELDVDTLNIPDTIDGYTVTIVDGLYAKIADDLYAICIAGPKNLIYPSTIKTITSKAFGSGIYIYSEVTNNDAFGNGFFCDVTRIFLSEGVENLEGAFDTYTSLEDINLPSTVKNLDYTFANCTSLKTVDIPNLVTDLHGTFYNCTSLKNIVIPDNIESIGVCAFYNCTSLKNIAIPKTVTYITEETGVISRFRRNEEGYLESIFELNGILPFSGQTINFEEGKNEEIIIPENKWGAKKILINGK